MTPAPQQISSLPTLFTAVGHAGGGSGPAADVAAVAADDVAGAAGVAADC